MRIAGIVVAVLLALILAAWYSGNQTPIDEVALASERVGMPLESRRIDVGELTLHVVLAGPEDGPGVVLIHGFPEFWFSWHEQMAALARAGFRVAAPDLRGYNRSDKPSPIDAYQTKRYVGDLVGLMDALGWKTANVAGHDVGGGIMWDLVARHPDRVHRAVVFQVPHPHTWMDPEPVEEDEESISWYRTFFRMPYLPELVGRAGNWWLLSRSLRNTSRPGTFDELMDVYKASWDRDGAISTMINSYRADFEPSPLPEDGKPGAPVRLVYGEGDAFIPQSGVEASKKFLGDDNVILVPDATHWILIEEPELTSRAMIEFFGS